VDGVRVNGPCGLVASHAAALDELSVPPGVNMARRSPEGRASDAATLFQAR